MFILFGVVVYNKWIRLKVFVFLGLEETKKRWGWGNIAGNTKKYS